MTNTYSFAEQELDILAATVSKATITPYRKELLALCEAFGKSGQSGGSAPYTAGAIADAVRKLLLQQPICAVTGEDFEWVNVAHLSDEGPLWQNMRCGGLFKYADGSCSYVDAIVWQGEDEHDSFTGRVYIDDKNFELISSSQCVRFPFTPRTFYIDVKRTPISKAEAERRKMHYIEDGYGECYYSILRDPHQLIAVFNHYDKKKLI